MRRGAVVTRLVAGLSVAASGCILDPFGTRLRHIQSEVIVLEQRIGQLESETGVTPLTTVAATNLGAGSLPETAGLPGIRSSEQLGQPQLPSIPINWRKAFGKLWRGLVNVLTGWVEIPKRVDETARRSGPGSGATLGVLRGIGHGGVRTLAGAYETVTFIFPAPPGYAPVIQPEYVFTCVCEEGWSPTAAPAQ